MSVGGFLPQGPTVRGPIVHPEKVDSWAPGPNCPGPNSPGPNCPGPNCPGPNCPGPNSPRTPTKPPLRYIPNCCCRKRIEFSSLDSSLVPLWGWILQTVVDFLGTSLQQVKICTHITTEKLRFKRLSGNSARYELATRSVVSVLIFTLVCIYVANIGLSYAEAKERQSLNASRMFRHIQTWNMGNNFPF